ncbi:MAG: allantoate amidohydrolase, partial [Cellulomonadaceae bacterium]
DARTVLARCDELARHSSSPTGIDRRYLTPEHAAVNALAATWMAEAGMRTWQDAAGNQHGRLEGAEPGLPALVLGSHLDSVPNAGRYDGTLGVLIAIAVAGRLREQADRLPFALEVVAFGDEEGTRFGATLLGSRALAGTWNPAWWDLTDDDDVSLAEAFRSFGLDPDAIGQAALQPQDVVGYLEVHIEQGPLLEEADRGLAVVSGVAGAMRVLVTLEGDARHCATPYANRRDAMLGACEQILVTDEVARAAGCHVTMGHIAVEPDAVNVVAGSATFSIDLRSADDDVLASTWAATRAELDRIAAERRLGLTVRITHEAAATTADPRLSEAVRAGIVATGDADPMSLPSIAGHDAMAVAARCGIGMLFVRCGGGVSHHPDESVREDDVALAVTAFERAVLELAGIAAA